jgi:RNA polymerase sigma-70 factor (TIGR02960 family)
LDRDVIAAARAGDEAAFRQLVEPHVRELRVHCYRILGSLHDAEDALQETLLAAWRGLDGFEERASLRTWLYRIATNRCLNALRATSRRAPQAWGMPEIDPPEPTSLGEVVWIEPFPDALLDPQRGPAERYEAREAISLAYITALQQLPARQRAVLILCEVLEFKAAEVASMLESTVESVTSALKRARATLEKPGASRRLVAPEPPGPEEQRLVERFATAYEAGDVEALVALLSDDVSLRMPPMPFEYQGAGLVGRFLQPIVAWQGAGVRLVPTGANGQPALAVYVPDPQAGVLHATGLLVLGLALGRVAELTRFDASVLAAFGLPRTLSVSGTGDAV